MRNAGVLSGSLVLLFAAMIFYQALSLDYSTPLGPGPGFFPRWLSGLLFILSILYIGESVRHNEIPLADLLPKDRRALGNIASTLLGMVLFMSAVLFTGFIIATTMLLFVMFRRDYRWPTALGISFGISVLLLLVFQTMLGVPLPVNEFGW